MAGTLPLPEASAESAVVEKTAHALIDLAARATGNHRQMLMSLMTAFQAVARVHGCCAGMAAAMAADTAITLHQLAQDNNNPPNPGAHLH